MMELSWPWMLALLPVPFLVRRFVPAAPLARAGALRVPFYDGIASVGATGVAASRKRAWVLGTMTAAWVALAGGLGSLARHGVGLLGVRWFGARWPVATLAVNLVGCFAIGAVMVLCEVRQVDPRVRIALVGGFLGGFTTYSAFAYETLALVERRSLSSALAYAGLTIAGCFAACAAGLVLARRLAG